MTDVPGFGAPAARTLEVVGTPATRIDGLEKVTGAAEYVDDIEFGADLLHAGIVESPHPHARIVSIDTSAAEALPGVVKVVTGEDFPFTFGLYMKDRYVFAQDRVRFVGEQVAAVVARDPEGGQARGPSGRGRLRGAACDLRPAEGGRGLCRPHPSRTWATTPTCRGSSHTPAPTSPTGARRARATSTTGSLPRT